MYRASQVRWDSANAQLAPQALYAQAVYALLQAGDRGNRTARAGCRIGRAGAQLASLHVFRMRWAHESCTVDMEVLPGCPGWNTLRGHSIAGAAAGSRTQRALLGL